MEVLMWTQSTTPSLCVDPGILAKGVVHLQFPRVTSSGQHRLPLSCTGLLPCPHLELEATQGRLPTD